MKIRSALLLSVFAVFVLAAGPSSAAILKGPYLQNVTPSAITVCFETDATGEGRVEYGSDDSYGDVVTGNEAGARGANRIYKLRIEGLDEGKTYHYRVGHGSDFSADKTFVTAPDNMTDFDFAVFGDTRGGSTGDPNVEHEAAVAAIKEFMPMFYLNTGDLVSSGSDYDNWNYFFSVENELMGLAPMYPAYGNHESGGDGIWAYLFETPNEDHPTWYSFDYGNVHFLVLDVEKIWTLAPGAAQRVFLTNDLEAYKTNPKTNFLLAFFHETSFSWKEGRSGNFFVRTTLVPILEDYGVDAILSGHDHFYARAELNAVPYVVTGGGGAPLYDFVSNVENKTGYKMHARDNNYVAVHASSMLLQFEVYSTTTGSLLDSFTVEAKEPPVDDDDDSDDDSAGDDSGDDSTDDTVDDTTDDAADDDDDDDNGGCCGG